MVGVSLLGRKQEGSDGRWHGVVRLGGYGVISITRVQDEGEPMTVNFEELE
jgi:hypothetical protein